MDDEVRSSQRFVPVLPSESPESDREKAGEVEKMSEQSYKFLWQDARRLSEAVEPDSVTLTLTSPPYWGQKDWGFPQQIGRESSYEEYLSALQRVFADVLKVTKQSGSLWIVADSVKRSGELLPLPFDLANRLKGLGWKLQDVVIWDKTKTLPWSAKGMFRDAFEYVLFFSKGATFKYFVNRIREPVDLKRWWVKYPERYNPQGKDPGNVWRVPIPTQGSWSNGFLRHYCPFPPALAERIIELTTDPGDIVLDCFAGTGIVVAQADCMDRKAIGLELNEEFVANFPKKVLPEVQRLWQKRLEAKQSQDGWKRTLSRRIQALRKLKYAYLLARETAKRRGLASLSEDGVGSVFAISHRGYRRASRGSKRRSVLDLFFVMNRGATFDDGLLDSILEASKEAPLSTFGIGPTVSVMKRDDFLEALRHAEWSKRQLWLYVGSRFNYYLRPLTVDQWRKNSLASREMGTDAVPDVLIISNVKVRERVREIPGEQMVLDVSEDDDED
ncbi:MAG TPA: site-specific DNA-methyltransferase [Thermoplasmata archaeon]